MGPCDGPQRQDHIGGSKFGQSQRYVCRGLIGSELRRRLWRAGIAQLGASEYFGEATNDLTFTGSNFAASGDNPGTSYPAVSPNVVAVGGTSISRNRTTGNYVSQSAWSSGG